MSINFTHTVNVQIDGLQVRSSGLEKAAECLRAPIRWITNGETYQLTLLPNSASLKQTENNRHWAVRGGRFIAGVILTATVVLPLIGGIAILFSQFSQEAFLKQELIRLAQKSATPRSSDPRQIAIQVQDDRWQLTTTLRYYKKLVGKRIIIEKSGNKAQGQGEEDLLCCLACCCLGAAAAAADATTERPRRVVVVNSPPVVVVRPIRRYGATRRVMTTYHTPRPVRRW